MQIKRWKTSLLCILCLVLIAVTALMTGCQAQPNATPQSTPNSTPENATVKGNGQTVFTFVATALDGTESVFEVHTDQTTVGQALLEVGLIDGEESTYGLYVKTVNGITLDYDTHGKYWAFYINGSYAPSGVDTTNVVAGATYAFKPE